MKHQNNEATTVETNFWLAVHLGFKPKITAH